MALLQSLWATGQHLAPVSCEYGGVVAELFEFTLPATPLAVNDIIELAVLPATNVPVDAIIVSDKLDSGASAAIAFDVGIMSGAVGDKDNSRTCGAELFSAATAGRTGGTARASFTSAFTIEPTGNHRSIGLKITAAAATQVASAKVRLLLQYRAA
ncbi:hypothetical protein [Burkholderia mayonis]|uniref:Uncharacterized protein n=1 Tax=Burkholderia mayonis TaxID=1385591 RepID=A0A1B4G163_9BURK|nr:hypothetical protein [Burkholderia mayonis]AOJ09656.1 hypothetical protein WS71_20310 [Burkholderia mayonis]KVE52277.1 hypothetical protein WS71_10135 [Burkholderia mayonis]